ncbi:MAG TPA: DNA polymerase III subunit gamma/tau [Bdellovibrionota bacterium]|nr:DNA polymerase III subunit gamma/tau [Bdellovibrionota bacterium]
MAGSYVVLARKWRSAQFEDVVGQGHIVRTLMNAVRAGRVHQAYLFTGSRGIGKTSIARIFAKVLRCEKCTTDEKSEMKWLRSCDECSSCKEIASSSSVDVIEIDGASNNGVEAVREIRENARYMPQTGARKIYIIDEVHMLTTAAFNALLKTLEEPPPHVIFIFATTEAHKIPATILSRCQRFDFRRYTPAQIQPHLSKIAKSEGINAEPAALSLIARAAEGGMRDALSLLDQVIAYSGTKITVETTRESIGLIAGQAVLGILSGIFRRKPLEALALVDQAYQRGHDLRILTRTLIEFLHASILAKIGAPSSGLLELSEDEWKELAQLASERELEEIELIFQVLHQGLDWIARSPQPKVVLDILLVKCATADALVRVDAPAPSGPSGSGLRSQTAEKAAPAKAQPAVRADAAAAPAAASPTGVQSVLSTLTPSAAPEEPKRPAAPVSAPAAPETARVVPANPTWEAFIESVRQSRKLLASLLEHGSCAGFPTGEQLAKSEGLPAVIIGFSPEGAYFKEQLSAHVYQEQLKERGREYFGRPVRFQVELRGEAGESMAQRKKREGEERERQAREAAANHPIIREARSLFGSELGPIEVVDPSGSRGMDPKGAT